MRDSVRCLLLLPLLLANWSAQAQIYMCKDAAGRTYTADRPIPECAGRTLREYDRKGVARREIAPPPTAEQKREMQQQEEKRRQDALAAEERRRSDLAIRFRYRNEADIELARKRAVDGMQEQIKRDSGALAAAEKRRQAAQAEVESYRKRNEPAPDDVQRAMNDAERAVRESKKLIADHEAEIGEINARHDETLKRYRTMTGVADAK